MAIEHDGMCSFSVVLCTTSNMKANANALNLEMFSHYFDKETSQQIMSTPNQSTTRLTTLT